MRIQITFDLDQDRDEDEDGIPTGPAEEPTGPTVDRILSAVEYCTAREAIETATGWNVSNFTANQLP